MTQINLRLEVQLRRDEVCDQLIARQILRRAALRKQLGLAPLKYGVQHVLEDGQKIRATDLKLAERAPEAIRNEITLRNSGLKNKNVALEEILKTADTEEAQRILGSLPVAKPKEHDRLEGTTQTVSESLFAGMRADRKKHSSGTIGKLFDNLLQSVMNNPAMQKATFFFIDVFPALKTPQDIIEHAKAYLKVVEIPAIFKMGLFAAGISNSLAAGAIKRGIEYMAKRFVAAETTDAAMAEFIRLDQEGFGITADLLGEHTYSDEEADASTQRYIALIDEIANKFAGQQKQSGLDPEVSVKISSLTHLFDPIDQAGSYKATADNLARIFRKAQERGVRPG